MAHEETLAMAAQATIFLLAVWMAGYIFEKLHLSSLVGEIVIGIAMGPGGLNVVPDWHGFMLIGKIGIFWLLFDGGAHLEVGMLRETGLVSLLIAFTGVVVPLGLVWGTMVLVGFTPLQGFVMGTALAPTSGGMAVKLMSDSGVLQTKVGQIIVCSAMTDDVFSLVILAIVSNLASDGSATTGSQLPFAVQVSLPIVSSLFFCLLLGGLSRVAPKFLSGMPSNALGPVMVLFATGMALLCNVTHSSEYMGAFLAGLVFSDVEVDPSTASAEEASQDDSEEEASSAIQEVQTPCSSTPLKLERVPEWLEKGSPGNLEALFVSIFFAAAGFNVPVKVFFDPNNLLLGLLCSVVALVGKLVSGVWCRSSPWCVGWAMVARGELGFVMASQALSLGLTPESAFNVTVWAVLTNTLLAPPIFQKLLESLGKEAEA